jgi:GNAT superfamily N-acetyltransferase
MSGARTSRRQASCANGTATTRTARNHALTLARRRLSATHVWADSASRVLGYATLAAGSIARQDLTKAIGHGFPDTIPAILLARLAIHRELQGQKLGGILLAEILGIAAESDPDPRWLAEAARGAGGWR